MTLRAVMLAAAAVVIYLQVPAGASDSPCDVRYAHDCGGVTADQAEGDFHGLIMVPGQPSVLDLAARSGTTAGCGDCTWTVILACLFNDPANPGDQQSCVGVTNSSQCDRGQLLYRLYLTDRDVQNEFLQTLCLGGAQDVVSVSDVAAADVARYLKDVVPPPLILRVQPPNGALAGLPAYFMVRPPVGLTPQPFGGGAVTETITITPAHYAWAWGDGSADLRTDDAGAPYPDGTLTHTYSVAGRMAGSLTAQWAATYTIAAGGRTFGPFDATGGVVPRTQQFSVTVDAAHSHLVSH
jgi:hypothetical protein